jgi:hypothetical protein
VDVNRAADLYARGWTLRRIGAELGVHWSTVSEQLQSAGITMRRGGPPHPASTHQIVELRDQGLTWTEVAEQVGMTVSGAWSRYRRARPPKSPRLGRWQEVLADALDQNLAIGVTAKANYQRRLQFLASELEEAGSWSDLGRADRLRQEIDALTDQLAAAVGLGGRDRRAASAVERVRVNVTKAIRSAIRRIAEHDGQLGQHLDHSVRTGTFCSYAPDAAAQVHWRT